MISVDQLYQNNPRLHYILDKMYIDQMQVTGNLLKKGVKRKKMIVVAFYNLTL